MKKFLPILFIAFSGLVIKGTASPVLFQNFSAGFGTWTHTVTGGGGGWAITSGATATQLGTVPSRPSYAMVNEALLSSTSYNNPATLTSPTFSLVGLTAPYLSFDQWYSQAELTSTGTAEAAWINFSTNGGTTWTTIDTIKINGITSSGGFNTDWATKFVSLNPTSANCMLQFVYQDNGGQIIGLALDNIMVYDAANVDLGYTSVTPAAGTAADYFLTGSSAAFSGTVTNYSNTAISSFVASYKVGTGAVVNNTITSVTVPALGTATFNYTTPFTVAAANLYPVSLWVTATGDDYLSNDSITTSVQGVNFMPTKRVLFEEGTGTWCGYCVRGIVFMDSLWKLYSNKVSIISVHDYGNYDPMSQENSCTQNYDAFVSGQISGFPSMIIDRTYTDDPSGALLDFVADSGEFGFADMTLTGNDTARPTGVIRFTATVKPAMNFSGNYNLEFVAEEDSVSSTGSLCASGWGQHDYYGTVVECSVSNGAHSLPLYGCGYNFNDSNTVIAPGSIKFPFVARWTLPTNLNSTSTGIAGSLPSTMTSGTTYSYTDSITIGSDWNAKHLRLVAMLVDANPTDANYGQVLNSVNLSFEPPVVSHVGINNLNGAITNMRLFPNPTNDIAHVQFVLNEQTNVQFSVYDAVGHLVFSQPSEMMNEGGQQINFSTANYPSGVYNIVVRTDNGTLSQRLTVIR